MSTNPTNPRCTCGYEDPEGSTSRYWAAHIAIWPHLRHGIAANTAPLIPRQDWVDAYQAGATVPAIARQHDTWPATVRRHLTASGVHLRDDRAGHTGGQNRIGEHNVDLARAERLHDTGMSWRRVADQLGIGVSTLHRYRGVEAP